MHSICFFVFFKDPNFYLKIISESLAAETELITSILTW